MALPGWTRKRVRLHGMGEPWVLTVDSTAWAVTRFGTWHPDDDSPVERSVMTLRCRASG